MSKKNILVIIITVLTILITGLVLWWLNSKGYIKILGSTNYYQKIESISSNDWVVNSGYDKIDYSSGLLKLRSTTVSGQVQPDTTSSNYFSQCCGGGCPLTQSISGNHEFYLQPNTYQVMLTDIAADDYFTLVTINGSAIIAGYEKRHSATDITAMMNLNGLNTITVRVVDTEGGAIGYHMDVVSYQHGQTPAPTTTFDNSGYYITKKFGADDLYSFDKIVIKNENKPANTDIYYEFLPLDDNGQILTDNSKCGTDPSKCISASYHSTNGEINLKGVTEIAQWKFFAIKVNLKSTNANISPSLVGFDLYYTTQLIIPNYQLSNTYLYQSKNKIQSKLVKTKILDNASSVRVNQELTLVNDQTLIQLPDNVSGNLKIYSKAKKHLSRKIEKIINSDAQMTFDMFLAGDFNEDDIINSLDWSIINQYWGKENLDYDVTGDDVVNSLDWSIVNSNWGKSGEGLMDNVNF